LFSRKPIVVVVVASGRRSPKPKRCLLRRLMLHLRRRRGRGNPTAAAALSTAKRLFDGEYRLRETNLIEVLALGGGASMPPPPPTLPPPPPPPARRAPRRASCPSAVLAVRLDSKRERQRTRRCTTLNNAHYGDVRMRRKLENETIATKRERQDARAAVGMHNRESAALCRYTSTAAADSCTPKPSAHTRANDSRDNQLTLQERRVRTEQRHTRKLAPWPGR
jgi:hypothetical protein